MPSTSAFLDAVHPEDRGQVAVGAAQSAAEPATVRRRPPGSLPVTAKSASCSIAPKSRQATRERSTTWARSMTSRSGCAPRPPCSRPTRPPRKPTAPRSNLLSMASHDLRTPLTTIQGYLETVLNGSLGEVPDEQREFLEMAHRNTQQLAQFVRDLLDLARIEAGRFPLRRRAVDVAMAIDAVVEILDPRAVMKGLQIDAIVAPGCPRIDADPERLHQVLLNVVDNAVKFTDRGGVRITAAE